MLRREVLEAESYISLFEPTAVSPDCERLIDFNSVENVPVVTLYRPQAICLNEVDKNAVLETISFAGRLCWDRDWHNDPERFASHIIGREHLSLLEHVQWNFLILGSRAMTHQHVRHRIGMPITQQSQRYISYENAAKSAPVVLRHGLTPDQEYYFLDGAITGLQQYRIGVNLMRLAPEDARYQLSNMMGSIVMTSFNIRSLRHYLELRMAKHAQAEIRAIANDVYDVVDGAGLGVLLTGLEHLKAYDPRG